MSIRADTFEASTSVVGGAPVGEAANTNIELTKSVVYEDKNRVWEGIMMVEELEIIWLCGLLRELQDRCHDVQGKVLKKLLEVVEMAKRSLELAGPLFERHLV